MPWSSREELVQQSVTLARQGLSRRAIARALAVSRNTVAKILRRHLRARSQPHQALAPPAPRAPRPTKLAPFAARIAELFERYPEITAQRVFEELRDAGYDGSYTTVKSQLRKVRPPEKPQAPTASPPVFGPGEMAECDSPYRIDFTSGRSATVQAFAYVLCFSHRKSFRLYERSDLFALQDGHAATFEHFAGAAHTCKYDGQKAVVLGWEGSQAIYNPRFLAFCAHYEFRPLAMRPRHPNDRPHVERAFWELERSFLCGRRFRDLEDMRQKLGDWQKTICDLRPHKKLRRTPLDLFADEAPHLVPLPSHPYDTARVVYRVCSIDGFVSWDGSRYAVPYDQITNLLPLRVTQKELFVYSADLHCIARHELAPRSAGLDIDPQGIHPPWNRRGADLDQLRQAFAEMGEDAASFFAGLATAAPRLCGYHARKLLLLRERYATSDLCAALRHARSFGAFDHQAVARILQSRASPRTLAEYVAEDTARRLEQTLGGGDTRPRDLDEYDRLPLAGKHASNHHHKEQPCPDVSASKMASPRPSQQDPSTSFSTDSDDTSTS